MLRDPQIIRLPSGRGNFSDFTGNHHRFLLLMETHTIRCGDNLGAGKIYRTDVTVEANGNDAEAFARAMAEGWQRILEHVKADETRPEGGHWVGELRITRDEKREFGETS